MGLDYAVMFVRDEIRPWCLGWRRRMNEVGINDTSLYLAASQSIAVSSSMYWAPCTFCV